MHIITFVVIRIIIIKLKTMGDLMKAEYLNQNCPECGCKDKKISRRRNSRSNADAFYIQHIPQGDMGIIKCDKCGHVFEYCKDSKLPVKVKKICII